MINVPSSGKSKANIELPVRNYFPSGRRPAQKNIPFERSFYGSTCNGGNGYGRRIRDAVCIDESSRAPLDEINAGHIQAIFIVFGISARGNGADPGNRDGDLV